MKKTIRIVLALLLSCILVFAAQEIYCKIQHEIQAREQCPVPKMSREELVSGFNENREKFEVVKNYMLTKDGDFYLNSQNYLEKVQDENVKSALKVILTQLDCDIIDSSNDLDCIYFRYIGNYCETRIIYLKNSDSNSPDFFGSDLGDNWRTFYHERDAMFITQLFHPALLLTAIAVLFVVFYLLIGLIPYFKKRKNPSNV